VAIALAIAEAGCGGAVVEPPIVVQRGTAEIALLSPQPHGAVRVLVGENFNADDPTWSPDHSWVLFRSTDYQAGPSTTLFAIRPNGTGLRIVLPVPPPDQVRFVAWGGHPAVIAYDDNDGIWVMHPDGSDRREIVRDGGMANALDISPNGSTIAYSYSGDRTQPPSLKLVNIDGTHQATAFRGTPHVCAAETPSWSANGRWLAFDLCVAKGGTNTENGIWLIHPDGTALHRIVRDISGGPTWSPDGERIAFGEQNEDGATAISSVKPDGEDVREITPFEPSNQSQSSLGSENW
jgi:Tol biopolymer transport system component